MVKTYKINGKEICGFPERSYGNVDITLLEERFNQLLEALNEEKEECKHAWIEYDREKNNTPIDICRNCPATKQPTSLKEETKTEQMGWRVYKVRNGCWRFERNDGSYTEHSTQEGARKMAESQFNHTCKPKDKKCITCGENDHDYCTPVKPKSTLNKEKEETKSTLREAIDDALVDIDKGTYLERCRASDKIISLFKDTLLKETNRILEIQNSRPDSDFEKGYTTSYQNMRAFIKNI